MRENTVTLWKLLFAAFVLPFCSCYEHFRLQIPNGNNVPIPCKPDKKWIGVGHKLPGGSGVRNPFGVDFAANGKIWTRALCEKDSDNDGRTNGQELGDVNCTWTPGTEDPTGVIVSHPGVCEPWNDPKCLDVDQAWMMEVCKPSEFVCDAIEQPGVQNMTLQLPSLRVPAVETTYMCQIYSIPTDMDYHMIATTPIIDNTLVVHHIVLFGCKGEVPNTEAPYVCGMTPGRGCSSIISVWTPGSAGECLHPSSGIRIGAAGFRKVALQIHWNNPGFRSDFSDQSGMMIYFTPNLRDNDAGILTTGQSQLWIPPQEPSVTMEGVFPEECSNRSFTGNIYVTSVLNHMHYLGTSQSLIQYRGGIKIRDIAVDKQYNYDNPKLHFFKEPIEIRPGDELKTTCVYSSMNRNFTTRYGDATSDEMCFSFITYFPKENSKEDFVTSFRSIGDCHFSETEYKGCNFRKFPDLTDPVTLQALNEVVAGCTLFEECNQNCLNAVRTARQHSCLTGDIWHALIYRLFGSLDGINFIMRLQSCACGLPSESSPALTPIPGNKSTCDWDGLVSAKPGHSLAHLYANVIASCVSVEICLKECIPAVLEARQHRCFQGAEWHYGRRFLHQSLDDKALEFLLDFESCNCEIQAMPKLDTTTQRTPDTGTQTSSPVAAASMISCFTDFGKMMFLYAILLQF